MDETKMTWFRWTAENAKYVAWSIWGAGIGGFGLVVTKAVDMSGITPPIYLGVLTVMMGGALGLLSSRTMDQYADLRKQRRQTYVVRMRIRSMHGKLLEILNSIAVRDIGADRDLCLAVELFEIIIHLKTLAEHPPKFEDVVASDADLLHAEVVEKV